MSKKLILNREYKQLTQRKINAIETKKTLRKVALSLFVEYGFNEVTIDDITTKAGVSKGTFYTHFDTKESVLVEEFKNIDLSYEKAIKSMSKITSSKDKLMLLLNTMTKYVSEEATLDVMKVVYAGQISNSKQHKLINNKDRALYKYVKQFLEEGIESGEFHVKYDIEILVEWIVRSARAIIYDWCLYNGDFDIEKEGEIYFDAIFELLKR